MNEIEVGSILVAVLLAFCLAIVLWRRRVTHDHDKAFRFGFTIWIERTNKGSDALANGHSDPSSADAQAPPSTGHRE